MTQKEFINLLVKRGTPRNRITVVNGLINVDGDVDLYCLGLTKIPYPFGIVDGYFNCSHNKLKNLVGSPECVGGYFHCAHNQLISLKGSPQFVGGNFYCYSKELSDFDDLPLKINGCLFIADGYLNNYKVIYDMNIEIKGLFLFIKF